MCAGLKGTVLNMQPTVIKGIVHPKILFLSFIYSLTWYPKPVLICAEHKIKYLE